MSRRLGVVATVLALVGAGVGAGAGAGAASAQELPVAWNAGPLLAGSGTPDTVPGANDFSCRPTAEHPRPVVLVHGLLATAGDNWATMGPLLKNNGFCTFALTYGRQPGFPYLGGLRRMQESAVELDAFVARVLEATGAAQVDLVGHSEGTVMPRWWLGRMGGAAKVKRYVQLTPLWDGTTLAATNLLLGLAAQTGLEGVAEGLFDQVGCGSCPQFVKDSSYLRDLNADGRPIPSIEYTGIATKHDELVVPYTSGLLDAPNVKNIVLQDVCATDYSEHLAVAYDPIAGQAVLNALDPDRAMPLPCTLMTPLGAPSPPDVRLRPTGQSAGAVAACTPAALTVRLRPRRGERIRRVVVALGGRAVATRRGRALTTVRVGPLPEGRHRLRVRTTSTRGTRTTTVTRRSRCA